MSVSGTINWGLLDSVMDHIAANKEKYDQKEWFHFFGDGLCNTTYCVAGWTAVLAGAEQPTKISNKFAQSLAWFIHRDSGKALYVEDDQSYDQSCTKEEYEARGYLPVWKYAQEKLGLSRQQANYLFWDSESLEEVLAAVEYLKMNPDVSYKELNDNWVNR